MANHFIPKIHFNNQTINGSIAIGSTTISTPSSTSLIKEGMLITSAQFPSGTIVVSKTVSTIEVSNGATNNFTSVDFTFVESIEFELPPKGDTFGQEIRHVGTTNTSKSGLSYTFTDYIQENNKVTFSHMSQSIKEKVEAFLKTWAFLGKSFTYFYDKDDDLTANEVEINPSSKLAGFKIITRSGTGINFKWSINLNFRKLL